MKKFLLTLSLLFAFLVFGGAGCVQINFSGSAGADGGVYKSSDKGAIWEQRIKIPTTDQKVSTIGNLNILSFAMDPQDNQAIYIGSQGAGLFYSYDAGESWTQSPTLKRGDVPSIAVSPSDKCTIYAGFENKVIKSDDCSRTWKIVFFDSRATNKILAVATDHNNSAIVYAGSMTGDMLKSNDSGASWMPIGRFQSPIKKILVAPYNSAIIYVPTQNKGIFKTKNAGGGWENLSDELKSFNSALNYKDLKFDLTAQETLVYASQYGLLKTSDGGQTWTAIELLTPPKAATIYAVEVNPKNGNDIFYSTATTFYRTLDGGKKWITKKLPTKRAASSITCDPKNPNIMYMTVRRVDQ
jgi:photosystem II stability/assembly factor-like uncharacterized protein